LTVELESGMHGRRPYTPGKRKFEDIPPHHIIIHLNYEAEVFNRLLQLPIDCNCHLQLVGTFHTVFETNLTKAIFDAFQYGDDSLAVV
jgi:hypothetical protein